MANKPVVTGLNDLLVATYGLLALTHQAHWNTEGSTFFELHRAFGDQYAALLESADAVAEQIRALDSFPRLIELLPEWLSDHGNFGDVGTATAVLAANQEVLGIAQSACDVATKAGDLVTQNLLLEQIAMFQKTIWMLKAQTS
jgi:starvation-inducible DNA-binding protein